MLTALTALAAPASTRLTQFVAYPGWHGGAWPFFFLIPLFWIAVVVLVVVFVGRRRMQVHSPAHLAEQTLAERFARGDIDEVEYRARLEVIRANGRR